MKVMSSANYVGVDQRISPRSDVYARVSVTMPDGRATMMTMVNISSDGVLVRHNQILNEDECVHLQMPVIGKVQGICVWSVGGRSGIHFITTIPQSDYAPLLRALGAR